MRGPIGALILGLSLILLPAGGYAAEFQLIDDLSSTNTSTDDLDAPCARQADAAASAAESGGTANLDADMVAEAAGDVDTCNETAEASGTARGLFEIVPNGEGPGDPVTVCVQLQLLNAVASEGDASAQTDQDLVLVQALSDTASRTLIRITPQTFNAIGDQKRIDEFVCGSEFAMAVGDRLDSRVGGTATAKVFGVGQSEAIAEYEMRADVGSCPELPPCPGSVSAPAISPVPLAMLAGVMLLAGMGVRHRRRIIR